MLVAQRKDPCRAIARRTGPTHLVDRNSPAAPRPSGNPGVAYPRGCPSDSRVEVTAYRLRLFEIANALSETHFGEQDMTHKQSILVIGDDALLSKISELNVSLDSLAPPWSVDYPL